MWWQWIGECWNMVSHIFRARFTFEFSGSCGLMWLRCWPFFWKGHFFLLKLSCCWNVMPCLLENMPGCWFAISGTQTALHLEIDRFLIPCALVLFLASRAVYHYVIKTAPKHQLWEICDLPFKLWWGWLRIF